MGTQTTGRVCSRRRGTRSFTLTELLVVAVVILILASLALAFFALSPRRDEAPRCLAQLRQVGLGYLHYLKDYDFWMPCAGNADGEHYSDQDIPEEEIPNDAPERFGFGFTPPRRFGAPTYELPWFRPAFSRNRGFPYWYEALQPYLDPSATVAAARKAYKDRTGKDIDLGPVNPQPAQRVEQARLMGLLACPAKPSAPVGYGYHYAAPFGNTYCYPNARDKFRWYTEAADQASDRNGYDHPVQYDGRIVPVPILWYEQYIHSSTLTKLSDQVLFCDTGLSIPQTRDLTDSRLWAETADNNDEGYVRFPLMKGYWPPYNKVPVYRLKPWRPMPRHGGKTACLFPDGGARTVPIRDLCNPDTQWGDPGCLFDNKPPNRPPIAPLRAGY